MEGHQALSLLESIVLCDAKSRILKSENAISVMADATSQIGNAVELKELYRSLSKMWQNRQGETSNR